MTKNSDMFGSPSNDKLGRQQNCNSGQRFARRFQTI